MSNLPPYPGNAPKPGERYRHFKGDEYCIVALARDATTLEQLVVYQRIADTPDARETWTRPVTEFLDMVHKENYSGPRFTRLP